MGRAVGGEGAWFMAEEVGGTLGGVAGRAVGVEVDEAVSILRQTSGKLIERQLGEKVIPVVDLSAEQ